MSGDSWHAMNSSTVESSTTGKRVAKIHRHHRKKLWIAVSIAVAITLFFVLLLINLHSGEKQIRYQLGHQFAVSDPQFLRSMNNLLGPGVLPGNKVAAFQNGDEIFPAMLKAIRSAQKTITFETYIYWSGDIGKQFADALSERARAGVKVHVLLDWVGSQKMDAPLGDQLQDAGAQVEIYHPLQWYNLGRLNNRTHRKLLVVDGKVGFT